MDKPTRMTTQEDLERLDAWFEHGTRNDAFAEHAFGLVDQQFRLAELTPRLPDASMRRFVSRWSEFTWHLFYALWGPIEHGELGVVKAVFQVLTDLCLLTPSEPAYRFAVLVSEFWEKGLLDERVLALLPPEVIAEMPAMKKVFDQWTAVAEAREEQLYRDGQMGY